MGKMIPVNGMSMSMELGLMVRLTVLDSPLTQFMVKCICS